MDGERLARLRGVIQAMHSDNEQLQQRLESLLLHYSNIVRVSLLVPRAHQPSHRCLTCQNAFCSLTMRSPLWSGNSVRFSSFVGAVYYYEWPFCLDVHYLGW